MQKWLKNNHCEPIHNPEWLYCKRFSPFAHAIDFKYATAGCHAGGLQIKALHNLWKLLEFVFNLFQYMQIFIYLLCIAVRWKFRSFRWPPVQRIKFKLLRENSKREKQWIFQSSHTNFTLKSVCQTRSAPVCTDCSETVDVQGNSNWFPKYFSWLKVFAAFVCWTPVHVGQCVYRL